MAQWLFADPSRNEGHEYWVVYGTRYEEDIYYREEFEEYDRKFPNFHYVMTLSRPPEGWTGNKGYVQDFVRLPARRALRSHPRPRPDGSTMLRGVSWVTGAQRARRPSSPQRLAP